MLVNPQKVVFTVDPVLTQIDALLVIDMDLKQKLKFYFHFFKNYLVQEYPLKCTVLVG